MAIDYSKLTKKKLEELGRENGIELDRRKSKATLIEELETYLEECVCGKTEDPNGLCDGSHNECKTESAYPTTPPEIFAFQGASGRCKCYNEFNQVAKFADTAENRKFAKYHSAELVAEEDYFIMVR
jgi:hypothetical protein